MLSTEIIVKTQLGLIDNEIRDIVTQGHERAKDIIQTNMTILQKLANTLLEKEVLDGNQIEAIIKGETV